MDMTQNLNVGDLSVLCSLSSQPPSHIHAIYELNLAVEDFGNQRNFQLNFHQKSILTPSKKDSPIPRADTD